MRTLSAGLIRDGIDVHVVAVVTPGTQLDAWRSEVEEAGVPITVLEIGARSYLTEFRQVRELLRATGTDVVHTHGYRPDVLHGATARRRGMASVSTLHGYSRMGGLSSISEWIQRRALGRFDRVVAVSRPLAELIENLGVSKASIALLPNAWSPGRPPLSRVEARRELSLPADVPTVGWIGRLAHVKGCDTFLDALARLPGDNWHACIIGDGPEREMLEAKRAELGLDSVRFAGEIPAAGRLLPAFDLLALTSRSEGTPMVLLEAMTTGVPIVATRVGGVPDVLPGPDFAWTVEADNPAALARTLEEALTDTPGRASRAERARDRVEAEFGVERWIRRHVELYRDALEALRG